LDVKKCDDLRCCSEIRAIEIRNFFSKFDGYVPPVIPMADKKYCDFVQLLSAKTMMFTAQALLVSMKNTTMLFSGSFTLQSR
jgi:hypothetical protein